MNECPEHAGRTIENFDGSRECAEGGCLWAYIPPDYPRDVVKAWCDQARLAIVKKQIIDRAEEIALKIIAGETVTIDWIN